MRRNTSRQTVAALAFALFACSPAAAPAQDGQPPKPETPQPESPQPETPPKPEEKRDVPPAPANGIPADTEIVTTASGLKYSVLKAGTGTTSPKLGDPVNVSYTGWLENGKMFDSSDKHGGPATFTCGDLIAGWNEALQRMHVGDKWKLTIPAAIGYGAQGMGTDIPPGATLVFVMELHDFWSFPKPDAAKAKTTATGLKYEILSEGTGTSAAADDVVEMHIALWSAEGRMLTSTHQQGQPLQSRREDMRFPFLKEAADLLKIGGRGRFEVPSALGFGEKAPAGLTPGSLTYWDVQLVASHTPIPVPEFVMPEDAKLTTTASGLRYEVVKEGSGTAPHAGSTVVAHYTGWLTDGTVFDSSLKRGVPASFNLGQVIPGWREGLQLMKPGAVYKFVIPGQLAYGAPGRPGIPPNATLVFQVELVSVK